MTAVASTPAQQSGATFGSSAAADPTRDIRLASLGLGVAAVGLRWSPDFGVLCPLRRYTGIPCPMCGMTTAGVEAASGDVGAALAANPGVVLTVVVVVGAWLMWARAKWSTGRGPKRTNRVARLAPWMAGVMLPLMWVWQLSRFDII